MACDIVVNKASRSVIFLSYLIFSKITEDDGFGRISQKEHSSFTTVAVHRARLLPGWVTVFGPCRYITRSTQRKNYIVTTDIHLGVQPVYSLPTLLPIDFISHFNVQRRILLSTRYCTAAVDKRVPVRSTSLYHCRQCSIVFKPRSDRIDYTVVCFMTHDCCRVLRKHCTSASWVWFKLTV